MVKNATRGGSSRMLWQDEYSSRIIRKVVKKRERDGLSWRGYIRASFIGNQPLEEGFEGGIGDFQVDKLDS